MKWKSDEERRAYYREYRRKERQRKKEDPIGSRDPAESSPKPDSEYRGVNPDPVAQVERDSVQPSGQVQVAGPIYHILSSRRSRVRVVHRVDEGGGVGEVAYSDCRCALIPHRPQAPAVYIIGAEEWIDRDLIAADRGRLRILKEVVYHGLSTRLIFDRLMADSTLFRYQEVYVDLEDAHLAPFFKAWRECRDERDFREADLTQAPFRESTLASLTLIEDWHQDNSLILDRSTVADKQRRRVSREVLKPDGSLPEGEFYALECLAHLVAGFHAFPPKPPPKPYRPGPPMSRNAWMAR